MFLQKNVSLNNQVMGGVTHQYMTNLRFFKNVKSVDYRYPRFGNLNPITP